MYSNLAAIPNDVFFTQVNHKGAFGNYNWLKGWTALDAYDFLGDDGTPSAVEEQSMPVTVQLNQNYPNPFNPTTTNMFSIAEISPVKLTVCNVAGQIVVIMPR